MHPVNWAGVPRASRTILRIVEMLVQPKHFLALAAMAVFVAAGCDKDPSAPRPNFSLTSCPSGDIPVTGPITLAFSGPVSPGTVTGGNVVVTDAATGLEIPGGLALGTQGNTIVFTPSSSFAFGSVLGIRIQNLLGAESLTPLPVIVCNVRTEAPPIAEVVWTALPPVSGNLISGASLFAPDSGWVSDFGVPLFRRVGDGWEVRFNQPYFQSSADVDFVSQAHGWGAHFDQRNLRGVITQTRNGGVDFDTAFTLAGQSIGRLRIDSLQSGDHLFGVVAAGAFSQTTFLKLDPASGTFRVAATFSNGSGSAGTSSGGDIDFAAGDTDLVAAVSKGVLINGSNTIFIPGRVYKSTNGGEAWAEIPNTAADSARVITYLGVAVRKNGDIYVSGGNGFLGRIAAGTNTLTKINLGISSRDSTDYTALQITDVEFAPDNDQIGWAVGNQLLGVQNGVPQRIGLIFETRDGGTTWIRQGVVGAGGYGAEFPSVFRIEPWSSTKVWITGTAGLVLSLNP